MPDTLARFSTMCVLVVDDNAANVALLKALLHDAGLNQVITETDPRRVFGLLPVVNPDLVLLDLQMPRMSGLEATRALRAAQPDVRVIILTGSWSATAALEARALQVAGFLLKGDGADVLPELIRTVAGGGTAWGGVAAAPCPPPATLSG